MHKGTVTNVVIENNRGLPLPTHVEGRIIDLGLPVGEAQTEEVFPITGVKAARVGGRLKRLLPHFPLHSSPVHGPATPDSSPFHSHTLGLGPGLPASGEPHTPPSPPDPAQINLLCKACLDRTPDRMPFSLLLGSYCLWLSI